jgi:transcription initiation factor TFIID subunit 5
MEADQLVLAYLKNKGYKNAEQALRLDAQVVESSVDGAAVANLLEACHSKVSIGAFQPEQYSESYQVLRDCVKNSINSYRKDLEHVLLPAFIYLYLNLLRRDLTSQAKKFFKAYADDHSHSVEVGRLKEINPARWRSDLTERLLANRFTVPISSHAYRLLLSFVESKRLGLLMSIMNEHMNFVVSSELAGYQPVLLAEDSAILTQRTPLHLVLPSEEDKPRRELKLPLSTENPVVVSKRRDEVAQRTPIDQDFAPNICFHTFLNATGLVCLDMTEDGTLVVGGFEDGSIRLWDLVHNPEEQVKPNKLLGHEGAVYGVCLSGDAEWLLSSSEDCCVRLWNLMTRTCVVIYRGHSFAVWTVKFSPSPRFFATGSMDTTARLWVTDSVTAVRLMVGHLSDVNAVSFHPNCLYVATGSDDRTVRLWEVSQGECVRIFCGHTSPVTALYFSRQGRHLYTGDDIGELQGWDLKESAQEWVVATTGTVLDIHSSQEEALLVFGCEDFKVHLVTPTGALTSSFPTKQTPVLLVTSNQARFTLRNLLIAGGPTMLTD